MIWRFIWWKVGTCQNFPMVGLRVRLFQIVRLTLRRLFRRFQMNECLHGKAAGLPDCPCVVAIGSSLLGHRKTGFSARQNSPLPLGLFVGGGWAVQDCVLWDLHQIGGGHVVGVLWTEVVHMRCQMGGTLSESCLPHCWLCTRHCLVHLAQSRLLVIRFLCNKTWRSCQNPILIENCPSVARIENVCMEQCHPTSKCHF